MIETRDAGGQTPLVIIKDPMDSGVDVRVHPVFLGSKNVVISTHLTYWGGTDMPALVVMDTATARLFAKAVVDAADKIDIEAFVEAGVPLQRSDCE